MRLSVHVDGEKHSVELGPLEPGTHSRRVYIDGMPHVVDAVPLPHGGVSVLVDGHSYDVDLERTGADPLDGRVNVRLRGHVLAMEVLDHRRAELTQSALRQGGKSGPEQLAAPMPGKVVKLLKKVGDAVSAGEGVVVVEAMKMENEVRAAHAAVVREIRCKEGQAVDAGAVLVILGEPGAAAG